MQYVLSIPQSCHARTSWEPRAFPLQCHLAVALCQPFRQLSTRLSAQTGRLWSYSKALGRPAQSCTRCLQQPQMIFPVTNTTRVFREGRVEIPAPSLPSHSLRQEPAPQSDQEERGGRETAHNLMSTALCHPQLTHSSVYKPCRTYFLQYF